MSKQIKAVSLISGGLDSMLATKAILEQGVHVEGINFFTGFCVEGHTHAIRKKDKDKPKRNNSLWVAETLGIKLHIIDIIEEYKDVLINPKHGYGAKPCSRMAFVASMESKPPEINETAFICLLISNLHLN
jgi:tRNA U34 2-thiouridine synthase MnmA/TrmU